MALNPIVAGGLADLGLNAVNAVSNAINNHKSYKYATRLSEKAYKQNLDMWNKTNEYNTPANQVLRLKAAGLNPSLAYGNGNVSGNLAESAPEMSYGDPNPRAFVGQLPNTLTGLQLQLQQQLNESAISKNNADALKTLSETKGIDIENLVKEQTAGELIKQASLNNESIRASIEHMKADSRTKDKYLEYADQLYEMQLTTANTSNAKMQAEIRKIGTEMGLNLAQISLLKVEAKKCAAEIGLIGQQTGSLSMQNDVFSKTIPDQISKIQAMAKCSEKDASWYWWRTLCSGLRDLGTGLGSGVSAFTKVGTLTGLVPSANQYPNGWNTSSSR